MKKHVRVGVEEGSSNHDRKTSLDTTGGSSMASWLGTQEDRDDFVSLSDTYLSSLQDKLGMEDDFRMKEDDQMSFLMRLTRS